MHYEPVRLDTAANWAQTECMQVPQDPLFVPARVKIPVPVKVYLTLWCTVSPTCTSQRATIFPSNKITDGIRDRKIATCDWARLEQRGNHGLYNLIMSCHVYTFGRARVIDSPVYCTVSLVHRAIYLVVPLRYCSGTVRMRCLVRSIRSKSTPHCSPAWCRGVAEVMEGSRLRQ